MERIRKWIIIIAFLAPAIFMAFFTILSIEQSHQRVTGAVTTVPHYNPIYRLIFSILITGSLILGLATNIILFTAKLLRKGKPLGNKNVQTIALALLALGVSGIVSYYIATIIVATFTPF